VGSNRAGADGVDANFAFLEIDGPSARKRTHDGFCCGITLIACMPLELAMEAFRIMEPPSFISGNAFCTVKKRPFTLTLKCSFKVFFGDLAKECHVTDTGIGE